MNESKNIKKTIEPSIKEELVREKWGSNLGFILAAAGSAIGLGTMWKLPFIMGKNGGGAFILMFLFFNIIVGLPLFIAELVLGKQSQLGVVSSFSKYTKNSNWGMVGWLGVFSTFLILGWYCVVAGWGFHYILMALVDSFHTLTPVQIGYLFELFRKSGDLNILWQVIFLLVNVLIVLQGLSKGIEKFSKIMTSGLFIVLIILTAYASTLSGFNQAVEYILYPKLKDLNSQSVLQALSLALFTLSLGYGIMITYGSYMSDKDDIPKTSLIVSLANFFISILIALMIFPMAFTFGFSPESGEGLIFKTLPYVFDQLPGSLILTVLFFSLLLFAALTSSVSMFEVAVANFIDLNKWSRQKSVWIVFAIAFVIGIPTALSESKLLFPNWQIIFNTNFLVTTDTITNWTLSIVALLIAVYVGFKMPENERMKGFCAGSSFKAFYPVWLFVIKWIVPLAILLVLLNRADLLPIAYISEYINNLST